MNFYTFSRRAVLANLMSLRGGGGGSGASLVILITETLKQRLVDTPEDRHSIARVMLMRILGTEAEMITQVTVLNQRWRVHIFPCIPISHLLPPGRRSPMDTASSRFLFPGII